MGPVMGLVEPQPTAYERRVDVNIVPYEVNGSQIVDHQVLSRKSKCQAEYSLTSVTKANSFAFDLRSSVVLIEHVRNALLPFPTNVVYGL